MFLIDPPFRIEVRLRSDIKGGFISRGEGDSRFEVTGMIKGFGEGEGEG